MYLLRNKNLSRIFFRILIAIFELILIRLLISEKLEKGKIYKKTRYLLKILANKYTIYSIFLSFELSDRDFFT